MALQSINLYYSYLDSFEMLGDAEVGRLIKGAITYARDGAEPEFRGNERFVWPVLRGQISRDQEAYEAKCAKQRDNIAKRWAKDTTVYDGISGIPSDTKHTKNKDKDKDKDKDNIERGAAPRFSRPSLEDVAAYCRERGNGVDPQRFIDYYTANGWRVGKQPMKDWRAAIRTWEGRERKSASRAEEIFAEVCGL